ncbi:glutathione S-transferase T3-like [Brassica napus]|uniref:glutathione S-transferase T3-like n=1 Tax=Brassica napus TaxID=3708 RepID=UPI0006AB1273|nr:glutathione S-transferase T3-like [Brassica napus]
MAVVEGGKSLIISLFVGLLDGEGPLSLCVDLLESKALIDGDIWISVGGSPQRRRSSLSMALRDSLRDQLAFDMFCGKRGQEGSSIQEGSVSLSSSQAPFVASQEDPIIGDDELPAERKERRTWMPTDDIVLISSWLNTSKDPVVGNEQKSVDFWKRIAAYFSASPKLAGCEKREASQCKQHWRKLNDLVCKFCGAYEAATREKTSGMNENDMLKLAHKIFFNNHQKKFILEHAWKELRADQKWCELSIEKNGSSSKRKKFEDGSHSASSQVNENNAAVDDNGTCRPPSVKAAKARGKKPLVERKELSDFQTMWSIKKEDLTMKEKLSKMNLLESLVAKQVPLADYEEALKKKLINELM